MPKNLSAFRRTSVDTETVQTERSFAFAQDDRKINAQDDRKINAQDDNVWALSGNLFFIVDISQVVFAYFCKGFITQAVFHLAGVKGSLVFFHPYFHKNKG